MTQLGQLYEKEKIEYANQRVREASIKVKNEVALKMLKCNIDIIDIMELTGLTEDEIFQLQDEKVSIPMTQLSQLYRKEKIEYANQKIRETSVKERTKAAKSLLEDDVDIVIIMKATGFTEAELLRLQSENVTA